MLHYEHDLNDVVAVSVGGTTVILLTAVFAGVQFGKQTGLVRPYVLLRGYGLAGLDDDSPSGVELQGAGSTGGGLELVSRTGWSLHGEVELGVLFVRDAFSPQVAGFYSMGVGYAW